MNASFTAMILGAAAPQALAASSLIDPTQPPAGAVKRPPGATGGTAADGQTPKLPGSGASGSSGSPGGSGANDGRSTSIATSTSAGTAASTAARSGGGAGGPATSSPGGDPQGAVPDAQSAATAVSGSSSADPNRLQMIVRGPGETRRARFGGRLLRVGETVTRNGGESTITRITDRSVELRAGDSTEILELLPSLSPRLLSPSLSGAAAPDERLRARP